MTHYVIANVPAPKEPVAQRGRFGGYGSRSGPLQEGRRKLIQQVRASLPTDVATAKLLHISRATIQKCRPTEDEQFELDHAELDLALDMELAVLREEVEWLGLRARVFRKALASGYNLMR